MITTSSRQKPRNALALRELEARASALLSVLLALFLSRVTGEVTGSLQSGALGTIELLDRTSDAVSESSGLASNAAAAKRGFDVVSAEGLGLLEGRANHDLERRSREVLVHLAAIDRDLAGSEGESHSSNRALSLTSGLDDLLRQGEAPPAFATHGDVRGQHRPGAWTASADRACCGASCRELQRARRDPNARKREAFPR